MTSLRRNILLLFVFSSICSASDPVRSDREILIQLCDSVMSKISVDVKEIASITLSVGKDTATSFFQPYIVQGLVSRNIPIYIGKDSTTTTLELNVQESSVLYGDVFTQSIFGERKCERTSSLTLIGSGTSNCDGKISFSHRYSITHKDTIAFSMIEQLTASAFPITRFTRPQLSFFDSVVEPAIVTVASGIIIYLFFTIRS